MGEFTDAEKREEALHELRHCRRLFAKMVRHGAMIEATAARRIAIMEEIAEDYAEKMQPSLFGG